MDPEELKYQINYVITSVLQLGKDVPLKSDGKWTTIVSFTNDAKDDPNRQFTTTLKAKPTKSSIKKAKITNPLKNALGELKEAGAGDRTKVHADVKYQFHVVEGSPPPTSSSSSS